MFSIRFWLRRPEEFTHFFVVALIIVDQTNMLDFSAHKMLAAFLVLASCRMMMHTIAREPNMAIFVEMVATIQVRDFFSK